ncbi:hypothetical protein WJ35_15005 [Burkholderia ubonensis]|uniref:Uncharacterized protein n=1 Tax=Burkholderia ubonensis TaxID=101571 RepID=A0A1B4LGW6_9BURK|nr:hypothetical protein WJ35_15005 [Burkholderia ubonensis]AOK13520.1 hypothetical protein WK31_24455 [Burkholderia vietnamiensis]
MREGAQGILCKAILMRALTLKLFDLGKQLVRSGFERFLVIPLGPLTNVLQSRAPVLWIADYGSGWKLVPLYSEDLKSVLHMIKFFFETVVPVHIYPECIFFNRATTLGRHT